MTIERMETTTTMTMMTARLVRTRMAKEAAGTLVAARAMLKATESGRECAEMWTKIVRAVIGVETVSQPSNWTAMEMQDRQQVTIRRKASR